ncbi:MAG: glutamate racemase [Actinomycetia bacterium]|nr:glutamate racemase [Actinomycetes bacterium]
MDTDNNGSPALAGRPIGIFDSGIGGMTVAREIIRQLPDECLIYFGDTLRCPYGPRPLAEIRRYAIEIAIWLAGQGVKLIVIACNSATAAALESIQRESPVPVIGVIEPGARAAVQASIARRIGVIGTHATVDSGSYAEAIRKHDAGITVFSAATPRFVEMVEQGLRLDHNPLEQFMAPVNSIYIRPAFQEIARDYLDPLRRCGIDTLVLGCTHYPLLQPLISSIIGPQVRIISSAEETARDVAEALFRRGQLAAAHARPMRSGDAVKYRFVTTAIDPSEFMDLASAILGRQVAYPEQISVRELEQGMRRWELGQSEARPSVFENTDLIDMAQAAHPDLPPEAQAS